MIRLFFDPSVWQEVDQFALFGILDPGQHISEPGLGINSGQFTAPGKRIDHGQPFGSFMTTGKQVVLSPQYQGPDCVLNWIVIDQVPTIFNVC